MSDNALMRPRPRGFRLNSADRINAEYGPLVYDDQAATATAEAEKQKLLEQRGQPGVISKLLIGGAANALEAAGLPGAFDPDGTVRGQTWGNALRAAAWMPQDTVEGIGQAITAPARAYRGEISDEDMIAEGLNVAGNMAIGGSAVPKPSNAVGSTTARLAANAEKSSLPGVVMAEAAREIPPVKMEIPFYRGSQHHQSGVDYQNPYWGTTSRDLVNEYADIDHSLLNMSDAEAAAKPHLAPMRNAEREKTPNVTPAVARFRNPLMVDAYGADWADIPFNGGRMSSDDIARHAKSQGHDGLVIDNVFDENLIDSMAPPGRTVAALRPGTVSSAFDPNNILYSNSKSSVPGAMAAEAGRQPWYKRLFGASDAPAGGMPPAPVGATIVDGYHGRTGHPITSDTIDLWGTTSQPLAREYAYDDRSFGGARRWRERPENPAVYDVQARFENPLVVDAEGRRYNRLPSERGGYREPEDFIPKAREAGHDGIIFKNIIDPPMNGDAPLADTFAALKRGTVYDKKTGQLLFENGQNASVPGALIAEAADQPKGIRAYHGSPHDFDRFDLSKIGTGEGAQAYGHGLYFAEKEGVARSYRDALAGQKLSDGTTFNDASPAHQAAAYVAGTKTREEAIAALNEDIAMSKRQYDGAHAQRLMRAKGMLERNEPIPTINNGKMYEVSINAHPDDFLDWDKPLSQQSEKVKGALGDVKSRLTPEQERRLSEIEAKGGPSFDERAEWLKLKSSSGISDPLGQEAFRRAGEAPERRLRDAGIPGIRYLDQGSRTAGEGSRNYVVFDDNLISILRKYGLLGTLGGGAAYGLMGSGEAQAKGGKP